MQIGMTSMLGILDQESPIEFTEMKWSLGQSIQSRQISSEHLPMTQ